jgi:hypothetical protein
VAASDAAVDDRDDGRVRFGGDDEWQVAYLDADALPTGQHRPRQQVEAADFAHAGQRTHRGSGCLDTE